MAATPPALPLLLVLGLGLLWWAAAQETIVNDMASVKFCMWPTLEAASMSCGQRGSVIVIQRSFVSRLKGAPANCLNARSTGQPEYPACRMPPPQGFDQFLSTSCNNSKDCLVSSFFTKPDVVYGAAICGNRTDTYQQRNLVVVEWGCTGLAASPSGISSYDPNLVQSSGGGSSGGDDGGQSWIIPVSVCAAILQVALIVTVAILLRKGLLQKKMRVTRSNNRERKKEAARKDLVGAHPQSPAAQMVKVDIPDWIGSAPASVSTPALTGDVYYQVAVDQSGRPIGSPPPYSSGSAASGKEQRHGSERGVNTSTSSKTNKSRSSSATKQATGHSVSSARQSKAHSSSATRRTKSSSTSATKRSTGHSGSASKRGRSHSSSARKAVTRTSTSAPSKVDDVYASSYKELKDTSAASSREITDMSLSTVDRSDDKGAGAANGGSSKTQRQHIRKKTGHTKYKGSESEMSEVDREKRRRRREELYGAAHRINRGYTDSTISEYELISSTGLAAEQKQTSDGLDE